KFVPAVASNKDLHEVDKQDLIELLSTQKESKMLEIFKSGDRNAIIKICASIDAMISDKTQDISVVKAKIQNVVEILNEGIAEGGFADFNRLACIRRSLWFIMRIDGNRREELYPYVIELLKGMLVPEGVETLQTQAISEIGAGRNKKLMELILRDFIPLLAESEEISAQEKKYIMQDIAGSLFMMSDLSSLFYEQKQKFFGE
ncbi:MAG TPA: hypothetical protein VEK38_00635, partial [Candidatus Bathyarchaeia archaeon]|nr:hypothetical protein [Candidatus Bathyarchaeia archaeon]